MVSYSTLTASLLVILLCTTPTHAGIKIDQLKEILLRVADIAGYSADIAQSILDYYGYVRLAIIVGALGNTASGAIAGLVTGGPWGAVVGGLKGLGLWWLWEQLWNTMADKIFNQRSHWLS